MILVGWDAIEEYCYPIFGKRTLRNKYRDSLVENRVVLKRTIGSPPNRRPCVFALSERVDAWLILQCPLDPKKNPGQGEPG